jgi:hypothetical protein
VITLANRQEHKAVLARVVNVAITIMVSGSGVSCDDYIYLVSGSSCLEHMIVQFKVSVMLTGGQGALMALQRRALDLQQILPGAR